MKRTTLCKKLNAHFKRNKSLVRFEPSWGTMSIDIVITDKYLNSCNLHLNKDFYTELERFIYGINIGYAPRYNNTGSCFSLWIDANTSYLD